MIVPFIEINQKSLINSTSGLDKDYSLYVNRDKNITKIKDKSFWELISDNS